MQRREYEVTVQRESGRAVTVTRFAMNAGIRASEAIVREHARSVGIMFERQRPTREGDVYRRVWVAVDGHDVAHVQVNPL